MEWQNTTPIDKAAATVRNISDYLEEAGVSQETQRSVVERCGDHVRDLIINLYRVEIEFTYQGHPNFSVLDSNMVQEEEAQIDDQERDLNNAPTEDNSKKKSLPERGPLQRAEPLNDRFKKALEEDHKDKKEEERKDKIIKEVEFLLDEINRRTK